MALADIWLSNFKEVVESEIKDAGGKPSDGYKAVSEKTGLGYAYVYQLFTGKSKGAISKKVAAAMDAAYASVYGDGWMSRPKLSEITKPVEASKFKFVYVVGKGSGGVLEERLWTDGDFPTDGLTEYAEVASSDPNAFIIEVIGDSMAPRYQPGEYALVEPNCEPEIEDDVLVRLNSGQTMIKRLLARRSGIKLGSYNNQEVLSYKPEEVSWIYYVAYPVPARKIKSRT